MSGNEPVSVHILDREYTVGVEAGERSSLMAAAKLLDGKMREVRGSNKMAAVDRVAMKTAHANWNCRAPSANCTASSTAYSTHRAEHGSTDRAAPRGTGTRHIDAHCRMNPTDERTLHFRRRRYTGRASSAVNDGVQNIRLVP